MRSIYVCFVYKRARVLRTPSVFMLRLEKIRAAYCVALLTVFHPHLSFEVRCSGLMCRERKKKRDRERASEKKKKKKNIIKPMKRKRKNKNENQRGKGTFALNNRTNRWSACVRLWVMMFLSYYFRFQSILCRTYAHRYFCLMFFLFFSMPVIVFSIVIFDNDVAAFASCSLICTRQQQQQPQMKQSRGEWVKKIASDFKRNLCFKTCV